MSAAREAAQREVASADPTVAQDPSVPEGKDAVDKLKENGAISPAEEAEATAWYLDEENLDQAPEAYPFQVNIAGYGKTRKLVQIKLQPLDRDFIQGIRKAHTKREGVREETDDMGINLALVVSSLVEPDLKDPRVRGRYQDPADVLRLRLFRHKSGLIDQIANKVMAVSGFDDDDVLEVEAAKNSS